MDGIFTLEKAWKNDIYRGHGKIIKGDINTGFEISIHGEDNAKINAKRIQKKHEDEGIELISRESTPLTLVYQIIEQINNFK